MWTFVYVHHVRVIRNNASPRVGYSYRTSLSVVYPKQICVSVAKSLSSFWVLTVSSSLFSIDLRYSVLSQRNEFLNTKQASEQRYNEVLCFNVAISPSEDYWDSFRMRRDNNTALNISATMLLLHCLCLCAALSSVNGLTDTPLLLLRRRSHPDEASTGWNFCPLAIWHLRPSLNSSVSQVSVVWWASATDNSWKHHRIY